MNEVNDTHNSSYVKTEATLATASSVEELASLLPSLRVDLHIIESNLKNAVSEVETGSTTLEACIADFVTIKDEIGEALEGEVEWIDENSFPDDKQRQEYINNVEATLTSMKQIPDFIVSCEDLKSSLETINTMLEKLIIAQTNTFRKIEDLLPKHESYELAMWYQEARERTNLRSYYAGFFIVLFCLIGVIFVTILIPAESDSNDAWYESLSQSGTLRFSLVIAFSGTLVFLGKQINSQKRIYEEYGHKETMMKTFRGFSSKLASIRNIIYNETDAGSLSNAPEILKKIIEAETDLLKAVIDTMNSNPARELPPSVSIFRSKHN